MLLWASISPATYAPVAWTILLGRRHFRCTRNGKTLLIYYLYRQHLPCYWRSSCSNVQETNSKYKPKYMVSLHHFLIFFQGKARCNKNKGLLQAHMYASKKSFQVGSNRESVLQFRRHTSENWREWWNCGQDRRDHHWGLSGQRNGTSAGDLCCETGQQ